MTSSGDIEQNDALSRHGRRSLSLAVFLLCLVWLAGGAFADTVRSPGNPIGPGTLPPSSYERSSPAGNSTARDRSSLANLPGPTNNSGNLAMTGNVSGGKYFHGYLPYRSPTSLGAPLGSTQMDSFLRYTSVPPELGGYAGSYSPFYSATGTVATTLPGYGGSVFAPSSPRVIDALPGLPADRPADVLTLSEMPPYQAGAGLTGSASYGNYTGLPGTVPGRTPAENLGLRLAERGLNAERESAIHNPQSAIAATAPPGITLNSPAAALPNAGLMTPEDYRLQLEQLQQDIERVKANALALEQSLKTNDAPPVHVTGQPPTYAAASSIPATPGDAVMLPPGPPAGRVRPDEGLLLEPRTPDPAPIPQGLQSVSGPRVRDVQWLPQGGQTDGVSPDASAALHAPLSAAPVRPEQTLLAPSVMTGHVDAVFAPQGRPGAATGSLWTELRPAQTRQAVPRTLNPALGGPQSPALPPAQGVKPSPEQVSAFIARLRGTSNSGSAAANPTGNDPVGAVPNPSQQLAGGRLLQTYSGPAGTLALPGDDQHARVAASRPQGLGMVDGSLTPAPNSGTAGSLTQERFDRCLGAAELYLRQGRYYRAAESFTLAAAYQPNDGRALLGKSYALFGAGEYLSSALYLARALELDPRAVLGRSDLVNAIGGPAVFAARITDLEQCAGTGDAPQLQFLLAYVYRQMNRPVEAQAALAAAEKQLAPSAALDLLKAVIYRP